MPGWLLAAAGLLACCGGTSAGEHQLTGGEISVPNAFLELS